MPSVGEGITESAEEWREPHRPRAKPPHLCYLTIIPEQIYESLYAAAAIKSKAKGSGRWNEEKGMMLKQKEEGGVCVCANKKVQIGQRGERAAGLTSFSET